MELGTGVPVEVGDVDVSQHVCPGDGVQVQTW